MRIGLCVFSLCVVTCLCGCTPVVSVHPLYTEAEEEKPYLEPRLEGEWIMAAMDDTDDSDEPGRPCRVSVGRRTDGDFPYSVEFRCPGSPGREEQEQHKYDLQLVSMGGALFFDARFVEFAEKEKQLRMSDVAGHGVAPAHLLGQVWVEQNFVRFAPLQSDWAEKNWPAGFLVRSRAAKYDTVDILTTPTPELRDLFSRNAGSPDAFGAASYLCRPGTDCEARAIADQLNRTPDDPNVLAGAARFHAHRGDFARATALMRHKAELNSDHAADQLELGRMLLLNRDFEGARRALAQAKEPSLRPSIGELVVRSYFLQGDYAGTVQAAKSFHPPVNLMSSDPIILSHFSLCRLGRTKEAEAYLREQTANFVGPAQEQLFLLLVSGRLTGGDFSHDQSRNSYYGALVELKNGKPESARLALRNLAGVRIKDNLEAFAAQVELERMPSPASK